MLEDLPMITSNDPEPVIQITAKPADNNRQGDSESDTGSEDT